MTRVVTHFEPRPGAPKVGIGGFFGYGNYGDELFLEVFKEHLGGAFQLDVLPDKLESPYFSVPVEDRVKDVDAIVIGGGDLVQPWNIDRRYFHRAYLEKPVFLAGLGVPIRVATSGQTEKPHVVERYRNFFGHPNVRFINARDKQSADWITSKVEPGVSVIESPDLVCGLTLPEVSRDSANPILGIVTRHRPGHDQDDDYSRLAELGAYARSEGWRIRHIILGSGLVGQRDIVNAERLNIPGKEVFHSEDIWDLTRAIGECSTLASMKFHGSVVATMYGIPSMVLIPTSKNRNFMRRIGRDDLLSQFDAENLVERFKPWPKPIDSEWVVRLRKGATNMLDQLREAILEHTSGRSNGESMVDVAKNGAAPVRKAEAKEDLPKDERQAVEPEPAIPRPQVAEGPVIEPAEGRPTAGSQQPGTKESVDARWERLLQRFRPGR